MTTTNTQATIYATIYIYETNGDTCVAIGYQDASIAPCYAAVLRDYEDALELVHNAIIPNTGGEELRSYEGIKDAREARGYACSMFRTWLEDNGGCWPVIKLVVSSNSYSLTLYDANEKWVAGLAGLQLEQKSLESAYSDLCRLFLRK